MTLYASEHQGKYPPAWRVSGDDVWNNLLGPYLGLGPYNPNDLTKRFFNSKLWFCPSAKVLNMTHVGPDRHYGLNRNIRMTENPYTTDWWDYRAAKVPEPSRIILVGEMNANADLLLEMGTIDATGELTTKYRISHHGGKGANCLFCDGHVEYREGILGDPNDGTSPWRWWSNK